MVLKSWSRSLVKSTSLWKSNSLILQELKHFPKILTLAILFPLIAALFEGLGIGFLLGFLQNLVSSGGQPFQTGFSWFDTHILGIQNSELNQLYRISALILISTWIRAIFNYLSGVYIRKAEVSLTTRLYKKIFEQLQAVSLSFFSHVKGGDLINTLTSEVNQLQIAIVQIGFVLSKGSVVIVYAIVALWISWPLTLTALLLFSLTATGLSTLNKRIREASFPVSKARSHLTSAISEFISGIRTVQAFATQDFERQRFYQACDTYAEASVEVVKRTNVVRPLAEALGSTILIGMIIAGMAIFVSNGFLEVASLLTFLFILFRMVPAIQELNGVAANLSSIQGSIQNIQNLLRSDNKPFIKNGYKSFPGLQKTIELIAVSFGYDSNTPVLRDITLTIEKGQTVALVGSSGAGKSTLADVIARFYDPTEGQIILDGTDLKVFDINSVRRRMAIVSQETFIFNASVRDNVAYGSENATEEEIMQAVKLANAEEFILAMPEGFNTILGDRGVRLSGGQRQRIAIARALLRDPEILILDEATSALDSVSEKLIQESLEKLSVGRTVIAIAHRLSTISKAHKVVVMEKGQVLEQGTYNNLLEKRGKLWDFHQIQKA
ncbi:heterocyst formation ABC transporter subunit HepA [Nodosilinea sp. E11]|uniref:heterocyst formation ABC transporter subunit HepA n=1 Tax=Nodosilinea sp. E11 TaxID=3037479 RepID=UPI0029343DA9|nr:heterocyst formation ABC transporter subunit HepA [Nodosilinea sp. E11]WOD39270.1 ABC transporter ATP-binding protein [Nodosilinea sp. E11]